MIAAIAATTVTVRIVFISLVIETGLKIKGPIYPKRKRQESSKTFHKSLGRKITIELSRRVGCSASALSSFIFRLSGRISHSIPQRRPIADPCLQFVARPNRTDS